MNIKTKLIKDKSYSDRICWYSKILKQKVNFGLYFKGSQKHKLIVDTYNQPLQFTKYVPL